MSTQAPSMKRGDLVPLRFLDDTTLQRMLEVQNELNLETNGSGWEKGVNRSGKSIDWYRCIYMEAAEAIDSFPWKHWKDVAKEIDVDNLKIELVDIWHFVLSEAIRKAAIHLTSRGVNDRIRYAVEILSLGKIGLNEGAFSSVSPRLDTESLEERGMELLEDIMMDALLKRLDRIDIHFWDLCRIVFRSENEFSQLYYSKAILNLFRQKNGYAEGKYKKNFGPDGAEDNVVLQEILSRGITDPNEIYQEMSRVYSKAKAIKK